MKRGDDGEGEDEGDNGGCCDEAQNETYHDDDGDDDDGQARWGRASGALTLVHTQQHCTESVAPALTNLRLAALRVALMEEHRRLLHVSDFEAP